METNEFKVLAIGEDFDLFQGRNMLNVDGAIMEVLPGGSGGFAIAVFLKNMNPIEETILRAENLHLRVFHEGDFVLTMIRFGNTNLVFELSFDPILYEKKKDSRFEDLFKSRSMYIFGIESSTNVIMTMRATSVTEKLFELWQQTWKKLIVNEHYSSKVYANWVNDLDSRYSIEQLWEMSKSVV